ncbi:MAG: 30S ribosomal protein S4 [Candidatus Jacksonbacteria bacterium]|jgi:small subunit ribosomal protein S4|nr:30S ribosomal protein S4 [Candidatus Jacksonbacteria bacterium]MBT6034326.1 30S ribosomal protein S4 [Candidatus Jacksonbacteria bacterium]MBT6301594.1 30S ribosomal protein S4 [Candidatus Jacksonbacteria bacterium]MBT6757021.1 30S ribosomal protein S4 [Candidatus Jacksonbacteria bacterium]MBT6955518.1 30S ribosomal protein S4 [Candidatus Jacksonbacteria bacterium]
MRYTGPKAKVCRREGVLIFDSPQISKAFNRRKYPPGMHGPKQVRVRMTEYGTQLRMKQRMKRAYGLTEKQFRKFFDIAARQKGDSGDNLLLMMELRLDNIVFRTGLAESRPQARQLVSHGHITVNGGKVDIPSYQVKIDDVVSIKESKREKPYFKNVLSQAKVATADWIMWEASKSEAKVMSHPELSNLKTLFDTRLIVEYYSR